MSHPMDGSSWGWDPYSRVGGTHPFPILLSSTELIQGTEMPGKRILLVDDEESVLAVLQRYAEMLGYQVFLAHDGVEALDILDVEDVDVVVTDVVMPRMDGVTLAKRVKELYPSAFVVGASGQMDPSKEEALPFDIFLGKPFDFRQIREVLAP